jgi:hypothetical protein
MIKQLFALAFVAFASTALTVPANASTIDVSALKRMSQLPLSGGKVKLNYDGQTLTGSVLSGGCKYQFAGINNLSVHNQGSETFVNIYSNVVSTCLGETERFYIDVIVAPTGKLEIARVYYRIGKTNHYLASCGTYASLTAPGTSCE